MSFQRTISLGANSAHFVRNTKVSGAFVRTEGKEIDVFVGLDRWGNTCRMKSVTFMIRKESYNPEAGISSHNKDILSGRLVQEYHGAFFKVPREKKVKPSNKPKVLGEYIGEDGRVMEVVEEKRKGKNGKSVWCKVVREKK